MKISKTILVLLLISGIFTASFSTDVFASDSSLKPVDIFIADEDGNITGTETIDFEVKSICELNIHRDEDRKSIIIADEDGNITGTETIDFEVKSISELNTHRDEDNRSIFCCTPSAGVRTRITKRIHYAGANNVGQCRAIAFYGEDYCTSCGSTLRSEYLVSQHGPCGAYHD